MNKNIVIRNFIVFILCLFSFSACQHDIDVAPFNQVLTEIQEQTTSSVRPDCPNPIKLIIVSRRSNRDQTEYYAQVYRENPRVQAILYSRVHNIYIGLTIMPPQNVDTVEQECSCNVGSFAGKSTIISISQPRNIVTPRGCPVCELADSCWRFFRG